MAYLGRKADLGEFIKLDSISGLQNNTRVTFPLTITNTLVGTYNFVPETLYTVLVVKNGNILEPGRDFTISNANITFTLPAPLTTDNIWMQTLAEPINIGTPRDNAVEDSQFEVATIQFDKFSQTAKDRLLSDIITFGI